MRKQLLFGIILGLVLACAATFFGLYQGTKYLIGRADISNASYSVDNSYIFISPLQATANGQEKIRVTVFILNNQGLGVLGKKVAVKPVQGLSIETVQSLTDQSGKAVFDASSTISGEFYLEVLVDDKSLPQKAHLSYH